MQLTLILRRVLFLYIIISICFVINTAQAWKHAVSLGYGWGPEFEEGYHSQAYILSGKLYKFNKIDNTLIATIDGTLAHLSVDTDHHSNVSLAAVSLALRAYFQNPDSHKIRPYVELSTGPAYLSNQQLGDRDLGGNLALQTNFQAGIEFTLPNKNSIDVGMHFTHYCNGGIYYPNQSLNIPYTISIGYQF